MFFIYNIWVFIQVMIQGLILNYFRPFLVIYMLAKNTVKKHIIIDYYLINLVIGLVCSLFQLLCGFGRLCFLQFQIETFKGWYNVVEFLVNNTELFY